jgi:8-oxo-dGTP pyrophosphatase MutT (NUDIX family)
MSTQEFNNITTAVIIFDKECTKVLLIQRNDDEPFPSRIAFPGGRLQRDEDIFTAARREVREEVGLDLGLIDFLNVYFHEDTMMVAFIATVQESIPRAGERKGFWVDVESTLRFDLAPNVEEALQDSVRYANRLKNIRRLDRISESVNKAGSFLCASTSTKGGHIGWDHFLRQGRIGVIGTALGVESLCMTGSRGNLIEEGIRTLENEILPDGGWGLRSISDAGEKISVTESTLHVLSALLSSGKNQMNQAIRNGADWLLDLQHETGGWGTAKFRRAYLPRVFTTAFAISVLAKVDRSCSALSRAADWLLEGQNDDGSWGALSAKEHDRVRGTAAHTARAVIALLDYDEIRYKSAIEKGISWLRRSYDSGERAWPSTSEVTFVSEKCRVDYKHFSTPWTLVALMRSGVGLSERIVIDPLVNLLSEQSEEGFWTHPLVAGQIPIWAIHNCLLAMNQFKRSLWIHPSELLRESLVKDQRRQLLDSFVSREISRRNR